MHDKEKLKSLADMLDGITLWEIVFIRYLLERLMRMVTLPHVYNPLSDFLTCSEYNSLLKRVY